MWPEQTRGWRQRWRGFRDALGDRVVAETVSGLRSEGLVLVPGLVRDDAVAVAFSRAVASLADVTHPALRCPRELHRGGAPGDAVLLSDYTPGVRLSAWMALRGSVPLSTGTVLHLAQQVGLALAAISEQSTGSYHGAVGLDRVVLTADGRVLLVEAGVGQLLAAQPERSAQEWWNTFRVAIPFSTRTAPFSAATDGCQLGVMVLELLLGRRLHADEYPNGLALLLGTAEETDLVGERAPLGTALFEWLSVTLGLDGGVSAPSIALVNAGLEQLLSDEGGYVAAPVGGAPCVEQLEPWAWGPSTSPGEALQSSDTTDPAATPETIAIATSPPVQADTSAAASLLSDANRHTPQVEHTAPGTYDSRAQPPVPTAEAAGRRDEHGVVRGRKRETASASGSLLASWVANQTGIPEPDGEPSPRGRTMTGAGRDGLPARRTAAGEAPNTGRTILRWGAIAVALTALTTGGMAGWRHWRERSIGQQTGTVAIASQPGGASIAIDGMERGKAPLSLALSPGRHVIVAKSASGLGRATIDVVVGTQQEITVPLQLGTDPGHIDISTEPRGAHVFLDGVPRGRSPVSLDEVPPGEHELVVEHGSARLGRRFTLAPAERLTVYVPLAGWIVLRTSVPLEVIDRGRHLGASDAGRVLVPAGRRRLQFVSDEFGVNTTQDVVVMAGQVAEVSVPIPAGVLSVSTDLPADVWVDGEPVGKTPTGNIAAAVGEHEVVVAHERWGEQRLTVVVGAGVPTRLSVKLAGATPSRTGPRRPAAPRRYSNR
jgi:hypothetical protein